MQEQQQIPFGDDNKKSKSKKAKANAEARRKQKQNAGFFPFDSLCSLRVRMISKDKSTATTEADPPPSAKDDN